MSRPWVPNWKLLDMAHLNVDDGEAGATARAKFLEEAWLEPPHFLRVIDCELSVREHLVVIIDFPINYVHDVQATGSCSSSAISTEIGGYTAISHTYGGDVYGVFNCSCAADCRAPAVARAQKSPCKHDDPGLQQRVIGDVLGMCGLLMDAGVRYAWHDGVCIAQHDEEEVKHFIEHIAWIYANAQDTVIFLHYIGRPMAPIAPPSYRDGLISRWQTRVWTFQEAALSKRRRYCVRMGDCLEACFDCSDFEHKLASWYEPNGTNFTEILDEPEFLKLVLDIYGAWAVMHGTETLANWRTGLINPVPMQWADCLATWMHLLRSLRSSFPTIAHALHNCSSRESKHEGDRINSILGLARVKGFSVHKDTDVERSTKEFFERMGEAGLAIALFTTNRFDASNERPHTWYPSLCSELMFTASHFRPSGPNFGTDHLKFEVRSEDGSLEVTGLLACVSLYVTLSQEEAICSAGGLGSSQNIISAFTEFINYIAMIDSNGYRVWLAKDNRRRSVLLGIATPPITNAQAAAYRQLSETVLASDEQAPYLAQQILFRESLREVLTHPTVFNLIFPAKHLDLASTDDEDEDENDFMVDNDELRRCRENPEDIKLWRSSRSFAAVMVRGDISASQLAVVEKVGGFHASPMLLRVLHDHPQYLTFLDKVVII